MGSSRVLSYEEAKKQPDGTVFTYPSTDGTTKEAVSRGGRLYYNWGMGIEMPECWSRDTFVPKENKLTYKQAIKYPVGTRFRYTEIPYPILLVVEGERLIHTFPPLTGDLATVEIWDTPKKDLELLSPEPTIAEVCEERGWGVFSDNGSHSVSFDPYICMYSGPDSFPASKVARIIDIIEEK